VSLHNPQINKIVVVLIAVLLVRGKYFKLALVVTEPLHLTVEEVRLSEVISVNGDGVAQSV
jgi:hypothetical protein